MTIGTAMVASTKVRRTGPASVSQRPMVRFSTVRVGKTAIQIIRASWCLLGGVGRTSDMVVLLVVGTASAETVAEVLDGESRVLVDEVVVHGDGGGRALTGGGDHLGPRVDRVPGSPHA